MKKQRGEITTVVVAVVAALMVTLGFIGNKETKTAKAPAAQAEVVCHNYNNIGCK